MKSILTSSLAALTFVGQVLTAQTLPVYAKTHKLSATKEEPRIQLARLPFTKSKEEKEEKESEKSEKKDDKKEEDKKKQQSKMSKEQMENELNKLRNEEKRLQKEMQKQKVQQVSPEKDW